MTQKTLDEMLAELEKLHESIKGNLIEPLEAYKVMMSLGGIYETGSKDIPKNLEAAFVCYEKAAALDGPEAYLGLSRLCRLICITTEDDKPDLKAQYAEYVHITCDPDTVARFGWPEIALNVGVTCQHMAEFANSHYLSPEIVREYYEHAAQYYALAAKMKDIHSNNAPALCAKELAELQAKGYNITWSNKQEALKL